AVDIPCSAYRSGWSNPRIEWKFQKGSSLVLFYYGGDLTGTGWGVPGASPRVPQDGSQLRVPPEPYRNRVQFSPTSIHFESVTREDSGKYICEVVVGDGSHIAKSEVTLTVQGGFLPSP
ncbi:JAM1 protein, partial [Calyptomena viridis]|nr:JAM1 protein [Calyptomena viridis]